MGWYDVWVGHDDVRRFIKRKDSDAGEAGRTLEELRGSLYNDMRTSEGAKRQQQRLCGPFVALSFNFMVAIGIIMANKLVMGKVGFNFPICLTLIHYFIAWVLLYIFRVLSLLPVAPPSKSTPYSSIFALGVVMSFSSGLANTSLNYNSVGFYQMAKIAVTPTIGLAEFILIRKKISSNKVIALVVVSVGVAIATVTDLEFNLFGACIAIAWIIPSAINKILWSHLQQQSNWTALALMWKTTPITIFFLAALMPILDPPGMLSFNWDLQNSSAVLISALLGFLLQWSGALALGATSATSHVVLGQFKTCVILLGGYVIFDSDPGILSILGALLALCGMTAYTLLSIKESKDNQTLPSAKPKSTETEYDGDETKQLLSGVNDTGSQPSTTV
uniref:Sugar phosphate transporter domain-containing protein n=2 Tax=Kalanchoe fedtschenkoi TaxID=63787 RepID=A0A7N0VL83_KALFE